MDKQLNIHYQEFADENALPLQDRELLRQAETMASKAYAPYSRFKVGAAVRLANGVVVCGSNQENAAYPSGLCAERVAVFSAAANYPDQAIEALAITTQAEKASGDPVAPCGACRQSILEYEHKFQQPIRVILRGENGKILVLDSVRSLLPFQFSAEDMGL